MQELQAKLESPEELLSVDTCEHKSYATVLACILFALQIQMTAISMDKEIIGAIQTSIHWCGLSLQSNTSLLSSNYPLSKLFNRLFYSLSPKYHVSTTIRLQRLRKSHPPCPPPAPES
jgi:hypothetical protein